MCRLFAMSSGREPANATFWLLQAPDSLSEQSRREPDGTGLGWFDEHGEAHVRKQAIAAYEDARFAREARTLSSRLFLAHVRFASTGALDVRNTHPFKQDGRLMAHNGVVQGLDELERHLGADMELVHGETDSERLFALITRETRARGGDVGAGIAAACTWVAANLPLLAINQLLADGEELWMLRYPDTHPLYLMERGAGEELEHTSSLGSRVHSEAGAAMGLVLAASEPLDHESGWRLLRSGELIRVDADLRVSSHHIIDRPPAHPLTLEDLEPRARASQQHGPAGSGAA